MYENYEVPAPTNHSKLSMQISLIRESRTTPDNDDSSLSE